MKWRIVEGVACRLVPVARLLVAVLAGVLGGLVSADTQACVRVLRTLFG